MRVITLALALLAACTPAPPPPAPEQPPALTAPADAEDFAWAAAWAPEGDPPQAVVSLSRFSDNGLEFGASCRGADTDFIIHRYVPAGTPGGVLRFVTSTGTLAFEATATADARGDPVLEVILAPGAPARTAFIEALAAPQAAFAIERAGEREVIVWYESLPYLRQCL